MNDSKNFAPERYDLFEDIVAQIQQAPEDIDPARAGDAWALATVILHPFRDGNGRTARMLGYIFRDYYDDPSEMEKDYPVLSASREGMTGFRPDGYVPHFSGGVDQSDPSVVRQYFHDLLHSDKKDLYSGTY